MNIPRCMSTQHPDNVTSPFFAKNTLLGGEDEIQEAYYAFSHLNCDEQMWDCEGKEVDNYVVKKLLTKYPTYFKQNQLGKDRFITLRVPNPEIEKADAKVLLETLESIPRSFDAANLFYKDEVPPIFEVILPMTSSSESIDRIYRYYKDFVAGKQDKTLFDGDIKIAEWIGKFRPQKVNVIPLIEDMDSMLAAHKIVEAYLKGKNVAYQRVFLARSDPAMNYGLVSAVLLNKIALLNLYELSQKIGIPISPIVGAGSSPFRGNLVPQRVVRVAEEYPSTQTFTIQSAFKYDSPPDEVRGAIQLLKEREVRLPRKLDKEKCLEIIYKYAKEYRRQLIHLAPFIKKLSTYVPQRRKRKLHIGLFGYSREIGELALPRAIKFTAALYSVGLPPEILALNALNQEELEYVKSVYVHFYDDLRDAMKFFNRNSLRLLPSDVQKSLRNLPFDYDVSTEHERITSVMLKNLDSSGEEMQERVLRAANLRNFLG